MDTGISILIYITYAYLYCLQLLLVSLDSEFISLDHFMIIEQLLELLLCTGRLRVFLFSSQKSSYRPLLPLLYYLIFWDTLLYIYQIYSRLSDRSMFRNDEVSATAAVFESHLPNVVTLSSKPQPQGTFRLVAQLIWSHSPMKPSRSSLQSSMSLLGVI